MKLPIYQVDAFTSRLFAGNPAAIVPLDEWLEDARLQAIATENNLSETAFFVPAGGRYQLRWFTPAVEVDLCGHATLASAYIIFRFLLPGADQVAFDTKSGALVVTKSGDVLTMDFPSRSAGECNPHPDLTAALGMEPREILAARDYLVVYDTEEQVRALRPEMAMLSIVDRFAVIVTAPSSNPRTDFVSRFFAPAQGIPEDPVTGSAHCTLVPYWAQRLGKSKLNAVQVSHRGGEIFCEFAGDRVFLSGKAVLYLEGQIHV